MPPPPLPLAGVRVLAIEQYGAGPYGSMLMAGLGADVVKIEQPSGGDTARAVGPHLLGPDDSEFFQTFNKGKRSVALDLKSADGRAALHRLAGGADAVTNNLRGDQPDKLGLGYATLGSVNPRLVCGHLSAYGRGTSRAAWPGYDYVVQAEAGYMGLTGEPDGPPSRFGLSMVDYISGAVFAFAVTAAILGARASGKGCDLDTSLFEVALQQLSYPATWFLNEGDETRRLRLGAHPSVVPSQIVRTADGWAMLMCQSDKFWSLFCDRAGRPGLAARPDYATMAARLEHRAALLEEVEALLAERPTAEWQALLEGAVPFAPVLDLPGALGQAFAAEIGMTERVDHPARPEGLVMMSNPIRLDGVRPPGARGPRLGEHTEQVLAEAPP